MTITKHRSIEGALVIASLLVVGCAGCGSAGGARPPRMIYDDVPPVILPVDAQPRSFLLRQQVTARYRDREDGFEAVLQKREGVLRLVGLGPMGTVAFALTLDESGVAFRNESGREVPFEPEHILADVQRVFYPWLEGDPPTEGTRSDVVHGLVVTERYEGGVLVERRFTREATPEHGEVIVRYQGWEADGLAPSIVHLDNGWYGYRLEIDTFEMHHVGDEE